MPTSTNLWHRHRHPLSEQQKITERRISESSESKRTLTLKAKELTAGEFIESRICPLLEPEFRGSASDCETKIVRNTGTGRLTIRYIFDHELVVFGKLYDDDLGIHCYQVNQLLWKNGFNEPGRFRVPKPLRFFDDHALLLMLGVQGTPLGAAFDGDPSVDLVSGSHEAAEWLAALHLSSLQVESPDRNLESLKLCWAADVVIKAVEVCPDKAGIIRELREMLEKRVAKLRVDHRIVLTHGRFHHDHVFLSPEATSIIDLDRCRPSDPAKDVAEFIRLMRLTAFQKSFAMQRAEAATSKFLSAYLARLPHAAESLGCYLAAFTFSSLLRGLRQRCNYENANWKPLEEFHLKEIEQALKFDP